MAWTKTTVAGKIVYEETLTLPTTASTSVDTSELGDKIPPGTAFVVFANTAATNTTADGDVDVIVSSDGTNYGTLVADLIASFDTKVGVAKFDPVNNSAHANAPYMKLRVTNDGNQNGESFKIAVVIDRT